MPSDKILYEGDTDYEHYQIIDMSYEGRPARVLFSGNRSAALSGIAFDDNQDLLFDYNQRFFELVCGEYPSRILLIGGGVYTLPMVLLQAIPKLRIDVIELDDGLDDLAERFFGFSPRPRLTIHHGDGRKYLENNSRQYDMVLIDAFTKLDIPRALSTLEAVQLAHRSLRPGGMAAVNIVSPYYGRTALPLRRQYAAYKEVFGTVDIFPADSTFSLWHSQNFLLVAQKESDQALPHLRYAAVEPPDLVVEEILHDEM